MAIQKKNTHRQIKQQMHDTLRSIGFVETVVYVHWWFPVGRSTRKIRISRISPQYRFILDLHYRAFYRPPVCLYVCLWVWRNIESWYCVLRQQVGFISFRKWGRASSYLACSLLSLLIWIIKAVSSILLSVVASASCSWCRYRFHKRLLVGLIDSDACCIRACIKNDSYHDG